MGRFCAYLRLAINDVVVKSISVFNLPVMLSTFKRLILGFRRWIGLDVSFHQILT